MGTRSKRRMRGSLRIPRSGEQVVPAPFEELVLLTDDIVPGHEALDEQEHLLVRGGRGRPSYGVPPLDALLDGDEIVDVVPYLVGELGELL